MSIAGITVKQIYSIYGHRVVVCLLVCVALLSLAGQFEIIQAH